MRIYTTLPAICPEHGTPKNRHLCAGCNAAYMRSYLYRRRREQPAWAVWQRAKKRAEHLGVAFDLPLTGIFIPVFCPVLDVQLVVGEGRLPESPSLDRINPNKGYVVQNCRVICDHANRIKGDLDLGRLRERARSGTKELRSDYAKVVDYVAREELLGEVRAKAAVGGHAGEQWQKVADFLERRFRCGPVV